MQEEACRNRATALARHCYCSATAMPEPCHALARPLPWHCHGPATVLLRLQWRDSNVAPGSHWGMHMWLPATTGRLKFASRAPIGGLKFESGDSNLSPALPRLPRLPHHRCIQHYKHPAITAPCGARRGSSRRDLSHRTARRGQREIPLLSAGGSWRGGQALPCELCSCVPL